MPRRKSPPPTSAERLLSWLVKAELLEEILGDLSEYHQELAGLPTWKRRLFYWFHVLNFLRPWALKKIFSARSNSNHTAMLHHYLKASWRGLLKQKTHFLINTGGLAVGMAVAMLIGLWIYSELSANKHFENYDRIGLVYQHKTINDEVITGPAGSFPLKEELAAVYQSDFKRIAMTWWANSHIVTIGDEDLIQKVGFMEPDVLPMFSFDMVMGDHNSLNDLTSVILSESAARALFHNENPMGKLLKIDHTMDVKVAGVFKDFPANGRFYGVQLIGTWDHWVASHNWMKGEKYNWESEGELFVELQPGVSFETVSAKIEGVKRRHINEAKAAQENPELFLHPMSKWYLYGEWRNGVESGRIRFVWLFGATGVFVLLLACINFVNLSTSQAATRAKEMGIRKSIGSSRQSLIFQLFTESYLVVLSAFLVALVLVAFALPGFNTLSVKDMAVPWSNPYFWTMAFLFVCITGALSGAYPAFYLSAMQPARVLKGTFKAGPAAARQRKVLTVFQFAISVGLIIGTIVVWQQVQHAKNRPIGYNREGLILVRKLSPAFWGKQKALENELKASGAVAAVAESASPATETWFHDSDLTWAGKDPNQQVDFTSTAVSHDYGRTVGWHFVQGRDFSKDFSSDSSGVVLNESAARLISLPDPVSESITWNGKKYTVIGVIQDMVVDSPYEPVKPALFWLNNEGNVWINIRVNPQMSMGEALARIESVFGQVVPNAPFDYQFVDEEFSAKFSSEEQIGTLATLFAALSIFISCLGLYAMAAFMAEQRTKEIGIRKVLGASAFSLWGMLLGDFVVLVAVACCTAMPVTWYFMDRWLQSYSYRVQVGWEVFFVTAAGALALAILTISYQAAKAARANPVKSLRAE